MDTNFKNHDIAGRLRAHGIRPSAHRVTVGQHVLYTQSHPSADQVWTSVRKDFPMIARATVYNTLNLFVDRGLLRRLLLGDGRVHFDPNLSPHHHLIDEVTGIVYDIPWKALKMPNIKSVEGFDITEYQVVMVGRKKKPRRVK